MDNKDITVVITSFKSEKKIIKCINSIGKDIKIIVIENSNDKALKEKLEKEYYNLKCVLSDQNLGYAKGNNLGLSMVNTKYALIINPDAEVHSQAINNFFHQQKQILILLSLVLLFKSHREVNFLRVKKRNIRSKKHKRICYVFKFRSI